MHVVMSPETWRSLVAMHQQGNNLGGYIQVAGDRGTPSHLQQTHSDAYGDIVSLLGQDWTHR